MRRPLCLLFGILDFVLFLRFGWTVMGGLRWLGHVSLLNDFLIILRVFFLFSLPVSGVGLCMCRNWGLVVSYFQFPFRFVFMLLTFWLVAKIGNKMGLPLQPMIYFAFALECVRLGASIWIHRMPAAVTNAGTDVKEPA